MTATTQSDIIALLDSSGSMQTMGKEPVEAINNFIDEQKLANENGTFSLWTFNTEVKKVIDDEPLMDVDHFSEYIPQGMTALHDSIGYAISTKLTKNNTENAGVQIKHLISKMEKEHNWKFIYLGANQDVVLMGENIGMKNNLCTPFDQEAGGLLEATRQVSRGISAYRSCGGELVIEPTRAKTCPAATSCPIPPERPIKVVRQRTQNPSIDSPPPLSRQTQLDNPYFLHRT
jgi:hypothetical protein